VTIQFLGTHQILTSRVYSFRVISSLREERMIEFSIANQLVADNKFKIQDLPDLCFARLKNELSLESEENVLPSGLCVTDSELKKYLELHYPAKVKRNPALNPES
jgi:hypothetical protein